MPATNTYSLRITADAIYAYLINSAGLFTYVVKVAKKALAIFEYESPYSYDKKFVFYKPNMNFFISAITKASSKSNVMTSSGVFYKGTLLYNAIFTLIPNLNDIILIYESL